MANPGDKAGDCPRCGESRIQIGYDVKTLGAYCENCDVITALHPTKAVTSAEARFWTSDPTD